MFGAVRYKLSSFTLFLLTHISRREVREFYFYLTLYADEKRDVTSEKSQFRLRTWLKYNPFFRQKPPSRWFPPLIRRLRKTKTFVSYTYCLMNSNGRSVNSFHLLHKDERGEDTMEKGES